MFIHFLSKKPEGWLRFNGRRDYLNALWEGRDREVTFYSGHLRPLFFTALNNPHAKSLKDDHTGLFTRIGSVPYLNGGLFQKAEDDDKAGQSHLIVRVVQGHSLVPMLRLVF
jgi:hypothetical protein